MIPILLFPFLRHFKCVLSSFFINAIHLANAPRYSLNNVCWSTTYLSFIFLSCKLLFINWIPITIVNNDLSHTWRFLNRLCWANLNQAGSIQFTSGRFIPLNRLRLSLALTWQPQISRSGSTALGTILPSLCAIPSASFNLSGQFLIRCPTFPHLKHFVLAVVTKITYSTPSTRNLSDRSNSASSCTTMYAKRLKETMCFKRGDSVLIGIFLIGDTSFP